MTTPFVLAGCATASTGTGGAAAEPAAESTPAVPAPPPAETFIWMTEQFADLRILRYRIPGWDELPPRRKELLYYLSEAALSGRDIVWDQNFRENLTVRKTLEAILDTWEGERSGPTWDAFLVYAKRVFFSGGIHHHYAAKKFEPGFDEAYFADLVRGADAERLPFLDGEDVESFVRRITPILFDPQLATWRVLQAAGGDVVLGSANNYYDPELTQAEVEKFYEKKVRKGDPRPISYGLNSRLEKDGKKVYEEVWKIGGLYGPALEKAAGWLRKAIEVAETPGQRKALELLVRYYETGDLALFDQYSVAWVEETESQVDLIHGFIETYGDPLGMRAAYESVVQLVDPEATKRIAAISKEAQWFEDQSPILPQHKKKEVKGVSARVINVVVAAGDSSPSMPIGINLPNANWIRKEHGSKSVNLGNVVDAYDQASKQSGVLEEFSPSEEVVLRAKKYGTLPDNLHTDMHEVIGHASGQMEPGIGTPADTLKHYAHTLEEARADLVALYYLMDPKLIEIGVMDSLEVGRSAYDDYVRNGLQVQLARIEPGEDLQEAHMRNRQLVSLWAFEKGKADGVIAREVRDGKIYFAIRDYEKLRALWGQLLREIQRIESQGDEEAGKALVETYGVKIDPEVHADVLVRWKKLGIAPYAGFINPKLEPVVEGGRIVDVKVSYPDDFLEQMLDYGRRYAFLPVRN